MKSSTMLKIIFSIAVAFSYVASIYYKRPQFLEGKNRNDINIIKFRFKRVSFLCIFLIIFVPKLLVLQGRYTDSWDVVKEFGLAPGFTKIGSFKQDFLNCVLSFRLILTLYVGVIVDYLVKTNFDNEILLEDFKYNFMSIYGFRDHLFAPITEELVYRAIILTILNHRTHFKQLIIFSPLLFGIAHIHHGYEQFKRKTPLAKILLQAIVQFTYTTLFGILCNYLFLKFSNIWCCIIVHSMCNLIGFPDLKVDGSSIYKCLYYSLHLIGILGFYKLL